MSVIWIRYDDNESRAVLGWQRPTKTPVLTRLSDRELADLTRIALARGRKQALVQLKTEIFDRLMERL